MQGRPTATGRSPTTTPASCGDAQHDDLRRLRRLARAEPEGAPEHPELRDTHPGPDSVAGVSILLSISHFQRTGAQACAVRNSHNYATWADSGNLNRDTGLI